MVMKIIFLDFDGVLNSAKYLADCENQGVVIDPSKLALLKQIIDATNARIVLSTSWREHWSKTPAECDDIGRFIEQTFSFYGLQIFDKTPVLRARREIQIRIWLDQHPQVQNFVVLDDMLLNADFMEGHFVKTSYHFDGLAEDDVQKAIEILNR